MLKIGCSEKILDVPLLAELYGYGPFMGRRNLGVHDPLYCRAISFNDDIHRALIIYTDTCTTDDLYARRMRAEISSKFRIEPDGIAFVATHTHSAPKIGSPENGIAWGEINPEYQQTWFQAVMEVAQEALSSEENIASATAGAAPLSQKYGVNRVNPEKNITDSAIRWAKFERQDGSVKLLLHNHGVHGVAMNGAYYKIVSADWMGAANRLIKERRLADMPLFFLGATGDINPYTSSIITGDDKAADLIARQYIDDLEKDMSAGGKKIDFSTVKASLKSVVFPVIRQNADELRRDAEVFEKINENHAARLKEMAILIEHGKDLRSLHDLQVISIGEMSFFFIPGEMFIEPGLELLEESKSTSPFIATVANGYGTYFPSEENMRRFPQISSFIPGKCFGFYEVYCYPHALRYKYQDNIASFINKQLLNMEK